MIVAGYGIDVSHHQGKIDWSKVARSGITSAGNLPVNFAILKCIYEAQSHRPDERFEDNYRGCIDNGINVGIYVYHASASLADPVAEAEALGADAVGMSTVPETIAANYLGLEVLGISCITNMATGIAEKKHSHEAVMQIANESSAKLCALVQRIAEDWV